MFPSTWFVLATLAVPSAQASHVDCASLLAMLAAGGSPASMIAAIEQGSVPGGTARCLAQGGAPADVVRAARLAEVALLPAVEDLAAEPEEPEPDPAPISHAMPAAAPTPSPEPVARARPRPRPRPMTPAPPPALAAPSAAVAPMPSPPRDPEPTWIGDEADPAPPGITGFVDASVDPLSTFSVDVDTGSYTLARRTLREGQLPPVDAVRVEEFVNYLPYEYANPAAGSPFSVDIEMAPSPASDSWLVKVGVQAKKVAYDQRKPVHLTFLVDTSGSMQSSDKLGLVKSSLIALSEELEDGDTVAVVAYAGSAGLVLPPTSATDTDTIVRALQRLTAGGSTAMGAGIQLAYAQADSAYEPGSVNRVIIASDGDANVGRTAHQDLSAMITGYARRGITLTTLGFGRGNYRDTRMEQIANDGDGNYFYIDSQREAERVLVERMTSTLEVVARDVKLQVEFYPWAVESYRLIGYDNRAIADRDFRNDTVDAGEVGAGHQVTALYEVKWAGPPGELGEVRLRHKAPGPDAPSAELSFEMSWDAAAWELDDASPQLRMATASAMFAEILRGSPHVSGLDLGAVEHLAAEAARDEYPEDAELVELIRTAQRLRGPLSAQR